MHTETTCKLHKGNLNLQPSDKEVTILTAPLYHPIKHLETIWIVTDALRWTNWRELREWLQQ